MKGDCRKMLLVTRPKDQKHYSWATGVQSPVGKGSKSMIVPGVLSLSLL